MPAEPGRLEVLLRRDRILVAAGLAGVALLAWAYLLHLSPVMEGAAGAVAGRLDPDLLSPRVGTWSIVELLLLFFMWAVMMVAMMVPSVAPLVLTFARARRRDDGGSVVGSTGILLLGYLLVWTGFSVLATMAQWALHEAALLSPRMVSTSSVLGGFLLVTAGAFQLTPLKRACLVRCRSPLTYLMSEWRSGHRGAFVMGVKHGVYCTGCCWMLMALLFVAGVMNLLWVAAIASFVLVEKAAPRGHLVARLGGIALMGTGIALLTGTIRI